MSPKSVSTPWTHLVGFLAEEDGQIHLGQVDISVCLDLGLALYNGEKVGARLVTGSVVDGRVTDKTMMISKVRMFLRDSKPQKVLNITNV